MIQHLRSQRPPFRRAPQWFAGLKLAHCILIAGGLAVAGCAADEKPPVVKPAYEPLPAKEGVPAFMHNTVWEKVNVGNTESFQVSAYGLIVNLDNTGDSTAPAGVRLYMMKEMQKHLIGSSLQPGWQTQSPERVLADKRVAIVQVVGMLPPGIRKGDQFDVIVQSLPKNQTSSLAGGELYMTTLKVNGADPNNPFAAVNDFAVAKGFVFVNPSYALDKEQHPSAAVRQSLRNGVILNGGIARYDRPLFLRVLTPDARMSRYIEQRLIDRFEDTKVAAAEDEAIIQVYVPAAYRGDWRHFSKVVTHVPLETSPESLTARARYLADEAVKPNAMLDDISFCWEGIGAPALPFLAPLLADKRPDVAFAAARAAAFIGDRTGAADASLLAMAKDDHNPFQLNAIQTLGSLPPSESINQMLRELLDSDRNLVRIEAYNILARNGAKFISTLAVTDNPSNQKFLLDLVPSSRPPLVYATRTGTPRIAIIGAVPRVGTPVMFSAMDDRLTISSAALGDTLTIFYRGSVAMDAQGRFRESNMLEPVNMPTRPDLDEFIKRLGGWVTVDDDRPLNFTYSEVIAILSRLSKEQKLIAYSNTGAAVHANFVLQDAPSVQNLIYNAPSIDTGRPQGDETTIGQDRLSDPAADAALAGGSK